ncbi:heterokaryon incompatibility protein-domain-containing protein [Annulohypoxylon maeteangense]|uniref:heterokaryon incompatibility protein-domain-containing protein n=1 Tax=Annulohypoxylon maeteangense TaxID=1927788 RepID=UPI002008198C|nr:heterokaryon incompatibility protein-domain-containing protein [Annulohypoxylon maeteangense]KAI0886814.1 heterokaryon incompatibility protein-domain-containing protein [Annulohypoxylon maeteangense]
MESSQTDEGHELAPNYTVNTNAKATNTAKTTTTLCVRCAEIDWKDIIRQACAPSTRRICELPPEDDISELSENDEQQERYFLKIEVPTLTRDCPVCILLSALVREEERVGNKVEQIMFGREDEEGFYGDADNLQPTMYGTENYQDPKLSSANQSWPTDCVLGLAIQEYSSDSNDTARTLRKIDPAKINLTLLRNWISTCHDQHGTDCNPVESELVPSLRVIDVRTGTIEEAKPGCKYVALSYVWGSSQPPANSSQSSQGRGLLETAPETIKDAAWLTEELGYQYIWIDRYCIPQDDPQAKHDQIQKMDLVYQQAELTIVAAAGEGPEFGLPGVGNRRRDAQLSAKVSSDTYLVSVEQKCESFFQSKWITRGWTYQESICSRRCIVFTKKEMFFQCKGMTCRETVREPSNKDFFIASLNEGPISLFGQKLSAWDHIESYCRRELSFNSDALNGILGILRLHQQSQNPVYHFWGMPFSADKNNLVEQAFLASLCWESTIESEDTMEIKEPRREDFPSWSWTGWKTPIRRFFNEYSRPPKLAGTVSVHLQDGPILGFQDAFDQNIKKSDFSKLSKFLDVECWTFELESNIREPGPNDDGSSLAWVWPTGTSQLDENSRAAISLALDGDISEKIISANPDGHFLALIFEKRKKFSQPTHHLESGGRSSEGLANFVIVAMKNGDHYERVGFIKLDDSELCRMSTSTFKRITRNGISIHSDSDGSIYSLEGDDDNDDDNDDNDDDGDDGDDDDDDYDDNDDGGDGGGRGLGGGYESFYIKDWLPKQFTWQRVKLG